MRKQNHIKGAISNKDLSKIKKPVRGDKMWVYIICAIIWIFFTGILIPERKSKRIISEIYGHYGMSFILSSLVLGLGKVGTHYDIFPLKMK